MRYPAPEKLEIIRLVEQSHLPVRATLDKLGITRSTFYRLYDAYQRGGPEAFDDHPARPSWVCTACLQISGSRSLPWTWSSLNSTRVNWRCASPTSEATSSQKRPSDEAAPGFDVGEVGDPQPVRVDGLELPVDPAE